MSIFKRHVMKDLITEIPSLLPKMQDEYSSETFKLIEKVCKDILDTHKFSRSHVEGRFHPAPTINFAKHGTILYKNIEKLCQILKWELPEFNDVFDIKVFFDKIEAILPKDLSIKRVVQRKFKKFTKSKFSRKPVRSTGCDKKHTFNYVVKMTNGKNLDKDYRKDNLIPELHTRKAFSVFCNVYGTIKGRLDNCFTESVSAYSGVFNKITLLNNYKDKRHEDTLTDLFTRYVACVWSSPKNFSINTQEVGGLDKHAVHLYNILKKEDTTNWYKIGHLMITNDVMDNITNRQARDLMTLCEKYLPGICQVLQHQWIKGVAIQAQMKYKLPARINLVRGMGRQKVRMSDPRIPKDSEKGVNTLAYNQAAGAFNRIMALTNQLKEKLGQDKYYCYRAMLLVARDQACFSGGFSENPVLKVHKFTARKCLMPPWGGYNKPEMVDTSLKQIQGYIDRNAETLKTEKFKIKNLFDKLFELTKDTRAREIKVDVPMVCGIEVPIDYVKPLKKIGAFGSTDKGNSAWDTNPTSKKINIVKYEEEDDWEICDDEEVSSWEALASSCKEKHHKKVWSSN